MATHKTGAKVGTRVANLVSKTIVSTHQKLIGVKHRLAMAIFHSISDMISGEVHQSLDPITLKLYESLPEGSPARALVGFMATETGQLQAGAGISAVAGSILGSLAEIINNELAPGVQGIVGSNPHSLPDPGTIAQLAAGTFIDDGTAVANIGYNGIPAYWANAMIAGNFHYPDPGTAVDMMRKNIIDGGTFEEWAAKNAIPPDAVQAYLATNSLPVSPADAALATLRGDISQGDAEAIAAESGINAANFGILLNNTGEPLGLEQLLEAYRREFISQATLEKGILESRVRDEWIPTALQLAYSPMSVADAVNGVVQNQLDQATAESYAQQNGLMPGMFQILLNTAGEPLSRTEMEELYNRGLVTEAQVEQALSESRLKNKYNGLAFELHSRLLNPSTLSDAVLYGAISENAAVDAAMSLGYSEANAEIMILAASNAKMYSYRTKVIEDIAALVEVNALDTTTATQYITQLGWSAAEAALIIEAAEYNRDKRAQNAAINAIRSHYISHKIDQQDAQTDLQDIGVPAGQITYLMQLWGFELATNIEYLTAEDVAKAVAASLMTSDEGIAYMVARGFSEADAAIIVQVAS